MSCPVCGTPVVPGARFCFACGAQLPGGTGPPDTETERRIVTVLFGDLSDFTSWAEDLDPERVGAVTDRVLANLAAIVGEHGGHVDKLVGDGIMAVFGAPVAHEDDPERAVRAAAKMQAAVRRLVAEESGGGRRLGLRVGLNTGEVVAGVQAHLAYTVVGDTVNTASRLSDAAGVGEVVAGRETALSTMAIAGWRALAPLRLKGKREPVEAFELTGLRPTGRSRLGVGDDAPFLGRDAELGLLVGRFQEVVEAQAPHAVLVTGDAGVGKTRLGHEVSRRVGDLAGARVLWGRCAPYGEGRDLAAVSELVRTACGVEPGEDVPTARERLVRTVARLEQGGHGGTLPAGMAEHLGQLLGLDSPQPDAPRESVAPGPPVGGAPVRRAVAALFSALAAQGPLLLVLDDLHWATPTLVDGLLEVAQATTGPVLLLALGRTDVLDVVGRPQWWMDLDSELLPLLPLEPSASERLLRAYLGASEVDDAVRVALVERSQGNPFFLGELLHLLVDRGVLRRSGSRWVLDGELPPNVLPSGVQSVLAARIDDLDGSTKGVLRDASVIGTQVSLPVLEAVGRASGHGDPAVVREAVTGLVERRLLEPDGAGFRFAHTLVRDVAYAGLAKVDRARRHAAAAAWARTLVDDPDADVVVAAQGEQAVRLATEMALGPEDPSWQAREPAYEALVRLGQAALARDEVLVAERLLARALVLTEKARTGSGGDPARLAPVHLARAKALTALHRLDEAEAVLAPLLSLSGQDGDAGDLGTRALLVLGEVRRKRGDLSGARQALVRVLAAASEAGAERQAAEALRGLGLVDYFQGRLADAERHLAQARDLAQQVGDRRGVGWALQHLAWSATTRGDYASALTALEAAAELFGAVEDAAGLSWVAGTEGFVRLLQGRFHEARELAAGVLPLGEQKGERWGVAALLTIDAVAAAELGEVVVAAAQAERARARFAEAGDTWGQALALFAAGIAARGSGLPDRAATFLQEAVDLSERGHHPVTEALALVALGLAELDRGQLDAAQRCAQRVGTALEGMDLEPQALLGARVLLAQVRRARGDLDAALAELDAALAALGGQPGLLFPRRQALAHRAGILLALGRTDEALVAADAAVAEPAEDVRSQVLALRARGSALRAAGRAEEGTVCLQAALEAAEATGQVAEVAPTRALLTGDGAGG